MKRVDQTRDGATKARRTFVLAGALGLFLLSACKRTLSRTPKAPPSVTHDAPVRVPFASRPHAYATGTLLPSMPAAQCDEAVKEFYDFWSKKYLRPACDSDQLVVFAETKPQNLTVSEAHGYGMIILAYMAGYDPQAKQRFDAMVRYHHAHPSHLTSGLMAWYQNKACQDVGGINAATDGDLDIAYAYLIADAQWGSDGDINYAEHAAWVIAALSARGLHGKGIYPLLGDWVTRADPKHYAGARVSDFMGGHFRAFAAGTNDPLWLGLLENTYWIAETLQLTSAPSTGLLPDFAENLEQTPIPAKNGFLEGVRDGSYAYNACRIPLRMGADFAVSGDPRAQRIAARINHFAREKSAGDPAALRGGYHLDGSEMVDYETMAFTAPFAVGAMVDPQGQEWLDALWSYVVQRAPERYYEDTLKMLSMLVVSGNWWAPEKVPQATP